MSRALSPANPVGRVRKCSKLGRQDLRHERDLQRQDQELRRIFATSLDSRAWQGRN